MVGVCKKGIVEGKNWCKGWSVLARRVLPSLPQTDSTLPVIELRLYMPGKFWQ